MALTETIATELEVARRRTAGLLAPLGDPELTTQHSPLMSPLVWDLAHIGSYEELWLVRALGGDAIGAHLDELYDAFKQPRHDRSALPLLGPADAHRYVDEVRGRALDHLGRADLGNGDRLLRDGLVYAMVVQHEHQHDETMLASLQLMDGPYPHEEVALPAPTIVPVAEVLVPGGQFRMGTDDAWSYDNERPAHIVDIAPFWIDAAPVTNGEYAAFIDAGGYVEPRWWSDAGWAWRREARLDAPGFWQRDGAGWSRVRFGGREPVPADEPVQHVCFHEADAYARWAGKRLPTEAEWEKAAAGASAEHANLGGSAYRPAPVGAYPDGASSVGCHQMLGDVWEWTSSDFMPHPGFVAFPYREYSEVFWGGDHKVLRGGSWATHPTAIRTTFRNWDLPIRRQIFAGFRCARDV
jgi:iron(II)-dependent oxidoreductase